MEKSKIILPNPCNANWDEMTPNDKGKHCGSCKKTVVDFTTMNDEQIKDYLNNHEIHTGNTNKQLFKYYLTYPHRDLHFSRNSHSITIKPTYYNFLSSLMP